MKIILATLLICLAYLQYQLWLGDYGLDNVHYLEQRVTNLQRQNTMLTQRNQTIIMEVLDLKHGGDTIEEYARNKLGMIKRGETFYQFVASWPTDKQPL